MVNSVNIKKKIKKFNKTIFVNGDKSISIRWVLLSSLAHSTSRAKNLLMSQDVKAAIKTVKKLGIKVKINKNFCEIKGNGINGYNYKKNIRDKKLELLRNELKRSEKNIKNIKNRIKVYKERKVYRTVNKNICLKT